MEGKEELIEDNKRFEFVANRKFCTRGRVAIGILLATISISLIITIVQFSSSDYTDETNWSLTVTNKGRARKGEMIFNDEFNTFDLGTWEHEITMTGGGSGEFQMYLNNRSNSFVKNGKLYIKPTLAADQFGEETLTSGTIQFGGGAPADRCTNDWANGCLKTGEPLHPINVVKSARIRTLNSFSFKYGRVEVRAKIPTGDWLWPAIWMMPVHNQYSGWPASGEIDIMESRGNVELFQDCDVVICSSGKRNIGVERVGATMHFGPFYPYNGWEKTHYNKFSPPGKGFNQDFHLYQMEWTPEHIKFSVDDEVIGISKPPQGGYWAVGNFSDEFDNPWIYGDNPRMAPFDQRFYFILNVAVGGNNGYFPDDATGGVTKPWINNSPTSMADFWARRSDWLSNWEKAGDDAAMQVDYVRVWAL